METLSETRSHGSVQGVYSHISEKKGTKLMFSVYIPRHNAEQKLPVRWHLSALTYTHANVTKKGGFRAACTEHGVILIAPDTSPCGDDVPDRTDEYDAVPLIEDGARLDHIIVDQGTADDFFAEQLQSHRLQEAFKSAGVDATIRLQEGYDQSCYFISTFIDWHAFRLSADVHLKDRNQR